MAPGGEVVARQADPVSNRGPYREPLPHRRMSSTERLVWDQQAWSITVGFDPMGRAREVFVCAERSSSQLEAVISDGCILLSILLQLGVPSAELWRHLGREGTDPSLPAATPIGLVAKRLVQIEAELGEQLRDAYRAAGAI